MVAAAPRHSNHGPAVQPAKSEPRTWLLADIACRHTRELTLSRIERVHFAVVGHGFRAGDLDKLAGFMAGTPIRSVVFIEAEALMRLVDQSIANRREFRLADFDRLLFGNKIIES